MTFTKEDLIEKAREQIAFCRNTKITGEGRTHVNQCSALFEIALAALESRADAEPVSGTQFRAVADLYSIAVPGGRSVTYSTDAAEASDFRAMGWAVQEYVKLERLQDAYLRPQPAPVVPEEIYKIPEGRGFKYVKDGIHYSSNYANGWNACRAAMLQGKAEQPHSTQQTGWTGNGDADAALVMLDRIDTLDSADDARIEDIKRIIRTLAKPVSQPYTLPEWIPCSERMPPSRHAVLVGCWWGREWASKWATYIPGHPDAQESGWLIPGASWTPTHWMPLPAAPQQEAE